MVEEGLGAGDDVALVAEGAQQHVLVLQQLGVLEDAEDLAEEGEGLLVELLGVADVGADDLVEGQVLAVALPELGAEDLRLDGQLAAHRVLGLHHVRVDVVYGEPAHCSRGVEWPAGA